VFASFLVLPEGLRMGKTARIPAWLDAKILRVLGVTNHLDILALQPPGAGQCGGVLRRWGDG